MNVTIDLPPRLQERVQAEAARHAVPIEKYLIDLVTRAVPETADDRRDRSLALLASVEDIGDESEQRETFAYLKTEIDKDRLSDRKRFA